MQKVGIFYIMCIFIFLSGCIPNFGAKQNAVPVSEADLYLTVGQTTMADVTKILNPDYVSNAGPTTIMKILLSHANAILNIHINDNGATYTRTLNLTALPPYPVGSISLIFVNGVLAQYNIR